MNLSLSIEEYIEKNKLSVKVMNFSAKTVKKGELNRNIVFFASNSTIAFIGTRGMINMSENNKIEVKSSGIYTDDIFWESLKNVREEPLRYIFCNYFVTL
ncbi:hypothetical protein PaeBR_15655 [Paenibacillus sp. BR2-3]|uniref:hypothetical protein n=1 Tax=Paenibacillus sp. BR2-3 TaxID=3048494 RepID=UPI0039775F0E